MSRNGTGAMVVPNTFISGTTITAADHNENWADAAAELTNSMALDGQSSMTGQMKAASGTLAAPGLVFGGDLNSGIYHPGGDNLCVAIGGIKFIDAHYANGVQIRGTLTNDAGATGFVGEYLSTTVARASATALTSGGALNPTGLSVFPDAGDWDVGGTICFLGESTTVVRYVSASFNTAAHTRNTSIGFETIVPYSLTGQAVYSAFDAMLTMPTVRYSLAAGTTIYLNAQSGFTTATAAAYGFIWARRVR